MNKINKTIKDIVCTVIILIITIIILMILENIKQDIKNPIETSYRTYTVQQGDNLTKIANKFYKDTYLNEAIFKIKQENNLEDSALEVGQVLKVKGSELSGK